MQFLRIRALMKPDKWWGGKDGQLDSDWELDASWKGVGVSPKGVNRGNGSGVSHTVSSFHFQLSWCRFPSVFLSILAFISSYCSLVQPSPVTTISGCRHHLLQPSTVIDFTCFLSEEKSHFKSGSSEQLFAAGEPGGTDHVRRSAIKSPKRIVVTRLAADDRLKIP